MNRQIVIDDMNNSNEFELTINVPLSLEDAENVVYALDEIDEDHLAEHVRFCIREAKQKAGYLVPK